MAVVALFALEIMQQVELVTVLLLTCLMLAALVEALLQQVLVEITTQVHNTAELLMVLAQVLKQMLLALLVFAGTIPILFQKLLVIIRKLATAQHHKEEVVAKLLQVELVIAPALIFLMVAVLAQIHHSLDLVVITTQEQMLL